MRYSAYRYRTMSYRENGHGSRGVYHELWKNILAGSIALVEHAFLAEWRYACVLACLLTSCLQSANSSGFWVWVCTVRVVRPDVTREVTPPLMGRTFLPLGNQGYIWVVFAPTRWMFKPPFYNTYGKS